METSFYYLWLFNLFSPLDYNERHSRDSPTR